MKRTIKFQLSNVKTAFLVSALLAYGFLAVFVVIALIFDPGIFQSISTYPLGITVLMYLISPFTFLITIYALFDGLMVFDTALRFGVSRKSYFITQLFVYLALAVLLLFATGATEVEWAGSTATYFKTIGANYLTVGNIVTEFLKAIAIAIITLGVYRYKAKAFIPLVALFGLFLAMVSYVGTTDSYVGVANIFKVIEFISANQAIFIGLLVAVAVGIYYLFLTKFEVKD